MSVKNQVKNKIKQYYQKLDMKPFPQGTRLVVLIDDKTLEVPNFNEAQYVDLASKHAGSVCVARYSNSTKRTRVMCRISEESDQRAFTECTSKVPTQITQFNNPQQMVEQIKKNLEAGVPTCCKIGDDYIYVTGRITNYDGEMERDVVLSIPLIMAEIANMKVDIGGAETQQTEVKENPAPTEDEFTLPDMSLHYDDLDSLSK